MSSLKPFAVSTGPTGSGGWRARASRRHQAAFTLMEVMVVMVLFTILAVSGFGAMMTMQRNASRLADYTAAMAVVEAKIMDIRSATYNPPNFPFRSYTTNITNSGSISLDAAGAKFLVSGTVVSTIQPINNTNVGFGHLVTVTGTFSTPKKPIVVSLQTIVNRFNGGQQ